MTKSSITGKKEAFLLFEDEEEQQARANPEILLSNHENHDLSPMLIPPPNEQHLNKGGKL